ncbi:MAG: hypothetical protein Kow00123_02510 [Anaerolineales bacterium]
MMRRIFGREWEGSRRHDWAIALAAMAAVALRWLQGPQIVDDAYITFRYAQNLAGGLGFVYNVGERVLGTTTPLYTLLLALGSILPVSHAHLSLAINAVSDGLTCILLAGLIWRLSGSRRGAVLGAVAFALCSQSVAGAVTGMETSLFTMLLVAAFYLYVSGHSVASAAVFGLAVLTRPEAVAAAGLAFLGIFAAKRWAAWREAAAFALVVLPWFAFAFAYFGSPVTNSVWAKGQSYQPMPAFSAPVNFCARFSNLFVDQIAGRMGNLPGLSALIAWPARSVLLYEHYTPWFPVLGAAQAVLWGVGAWAALRRHAAAWPVFAFPLAYAAAYSVMNPLMFEWYFVPPVPFYIAGIVVGLVAAGRWVQRRVGSLRRAEAGAFAAALGAVLAVQLLGYNLVPDAGGGWLSLRRPIWLERENLYRDVAQRLDPVVTPATLVAAPEIGAVGYYCDATILDTVGLVSPQAIPFNPVDPALTDSNYAVPEPLVYAFMPEYIVALEIFIRKTLLPSEKFRSLYALLMRVETRAWGTDGLLVFRRAVP